MGFFQRFSSSFFAIVASLFLFSGVALAEGKQQSPEVRLPIAQKVWAKTGGIDPTTTAARFRACRSENPSLTRSSESQAILSFHQKYGREIHAAASKKKLPFGTLFAILYQESRGDPCAISAHGALGLGQHLPPAAKDSGLRNPFDGKQAVMATATYLALLKEQMHGDITKTLIAYSDGAGGARTWLKENAKKGPEGHFYVRAHEGVSRLIAAAFAPAPGRKV